MLAALDRLQEAISVDTIHRQQAPLIHRLDVLMLRMFREQSKAVVKGLHPEAVYVLTEAAIPAHILILLDRLLDQSKATYAAAMAKLTAKALARGAYEQWADLEVRGTWDMTTERIERLIARAGTRITGINSFTRDKIRQILEDGIAAHRTYTQVARDIRAKFRDFSPDRARLIAVTEIGQAYIDGQMEVGRDVIATGIRTEKAWPTVRDERVDPHCAGNESEGWIPFGQAFSSGSNAPLDHPRCRCSLLLRRVPN